MQNLQLGFGARDVHVVNHALTLESLWQVSVVIYGETIRTHANNQIQCRFKTLHRLVRQPVNKVERYGFKAGIARGEHEVENLVRGLRAIDGVLYERIKVLDTQAQAVEAELGQMPDAALIDRSWIDFD